jgi:hypothetical protein
VFVYLYFATLFSSFSKPSYTSSPLHLDHFHSSCFPPPLRPHSQAALVDGFNSISIDTWLDVIPQLIARIHTPQPPIRRLIHELLTRVGRAHPQVGYFDLSVFVIYFCLICRCDGFKHSSLWVNTSKFNIGLLARTQSLCYFYSVISFTISSFSSLQTLTISHMRIRPSPLPSPNTRNISQYLSCTFTISPPPPTQALIYPLTVASKSQAPARKEADLNILDKMRAHSIIVVEQVRDRVREIERKSVCGSVRELWQMFCDRLIFVTLFEISVVEWL